MIYCSLKALLIFITFSSISLYANENWIKIESTTKTKATKTKQDIDLSQIKPINNMIQKATVVKQLLDVVSKKEKQTTNDKKWFALQVEENQQ